MDFSYGKKMREWISNTHHICKTHILARIIRCLQLNDDCFADSSRVVYVCAFVFILWFLNIVEATIFCWNSFYSILFQKHMQRANTRTSRNRIWSGRNETKQEAHTHTHHTRKRSSEENDNHVIINDNLNAKNIEAKERRGKKSGEKKKEAPLGLPHAIRKREPPCRTFKEHSFESIGFSISISNWITQKSQWSHIWANASRTEHVSVVKWGEGGFENVTNWDQSLNELRMNNLQF